MSEATSPAAQDPRSDRPTGRRSRSAAERRGVAINAVRRAPQVFLQRFWQELRRLSLGMLVSLAVHVSLLLILAIYVIHQSRDDDVSPMLGGFNRGKSTRKVRNVEPVTIAPIAPVAAAGQSTQKQRPAGETEVAPVAVRKPAEVNVAGALASRVARATSDPDRKSSSNDDADQAVRRGLNWLAQIQRPDGHWELHTGYPDAGEIHTDTGATALALLCFLGAGQTHQTGEHRERISRGIDWLKRIQKQGDFLKGDFFDSSQEGENASFYAHAQATMALAEALVLTGDESLRQAVVDGLTFIADGQHPRTGGWKYRRGSEGDLSVFGWQIMALQTGRMAGIEPAGDVLDRATRFLDLVQLDEGARYRYEPSSRASTPAMTAEGLLCRQYLGWPREHPAFQSAVQYLLQPELRPRWESGRRNVYLWYYAAQMLHHLEGPEWEEWSAEVRRELVRNQVKSGARLAGSWNPRQPAGSVDEYSEKGGRLYISCLAILTLEVDYRHVPIYRVQQPVSEP